MKRNWGLKLLALFLAMLVAFIIIVCGAVVAPPRYTAQNSFTIDWEHLPMSLGLHKSKEEIAKLRSETIAIITTPDMNRVASRLCSFQGLPDSSIPLLTVKLSRYLKVSRTGSKATIDFFTVQYKDNNASSASLVSQEVANRQKDIVNLNIAGENVGDVFNTLQKNEELAQKQKDLKSAIYELERAQEEQFSNERQQQIREYKSELSDLGDVETKAGFDRFSMVLDLFAPNPVQIEKNVVLKKRGPAYGIFVLTLAALGGVAVWVFFYLFTKGKKLPPKLAPPKLTLL